MDAESGAATQDWMALQRSILALRGEIVEATDPDERAALVQQLRDTRATIAEIEKRQREPDVPEEAPEDETSIEEPVSEETPETAAEPVIEEPLPQEPVAAKPVTAEQVVEEPAAESEVAAPVRPEHEPAASEPARTPAITGTIDHLDPAGTSGFEDKPERRWPLVLAAAATVVAIVGIGAIALPRSSDTDTEAAAVDTAEDTPAGNAPTTPSGNIAAADDSASDNDAQAPASGESDATTTGSTPGQPKLRVSIYEHRFTSQGDVPSQQTVDDIEQTAAAAFGQRTNVSVKVDGALDSPAWVDETPLLTQSLLLLVEGEIIITGDETLVGGTATSENHDRLIADLEAAGFPPVSTFVDVIPANPVNLTATVENGLVTLAGTLPDEATTQIIVEDLVAAFGEDNVVVGVAIDETKVARPAVAAFGADVAALAEFPNVVVGLDDDTFYVVLDEGLEFEPGESELDTATAANLAPLVPILLRTNEPVSIDGYTDSSGEHDTNHELSLLRADSVAGVLFEGGVDPTRLSTNGFGDGKPIASNDTAEGRARNRRIEIVVG